MNLVELLDERAILLGLEAADAAAVIRRLGGVLFNLGCVRDTFVEATLTREATMPTGLRLAGAINAAIPHAEVEHVVRPALALATLARPVVFRNMVDPEDPVPVRLVILLALDQPKSQVEALQQVASLLQTPGVVERLVAATRVQEVRQALAAVVP